MVAVNKIHKGRNNQMVIRKLAVALAIATVTLFTGVSVLSLAEDEDMVFQKGYVVVSSYSSHLNVRQEATTASAVVGKYGAGDIVEIVGEEENWYKIKFSDSTAYVSKDYVTVPEKDTAQYELMAAAVITSAGSSDNRNFNMALACEKINGLVLDPGEKFDWYGENGVGPANEENGFKQSKIIVGGNYVDGYGGGVCQVSTAMYNVIYDLGITPDVLFHHSLTSSYVEKDMDATVSYGSKNFIFTNSKDYAIEFEAYADGGQVVILAYKVVK